jgi:hypothetical protein
MSKDLQEEILGLADENPQYSNGLGTGLGYIFTSLKSELQKEILERAEKNSELTRGLGYGFANNFLSLNKEYQRTLFEKAEKNAGSSCWIFDHMTRFKYFVYELIFAYQ